MPYWYYEKKELRHTPSVVQSMTVDEETIFRREGARFILQLGNKMGLRYETMATGVVYFHRFYMLHAFQEFPRHVTACCCLFLAGKVEETPKKCKDIMRHARALVDDATWAEFGTDPKEEVMTLERIILQTIKFDFIVEHPYTYLLKYAKGLKGDKKKLQSMVQMAWTFVNDGLCTTLCLQWEPEIIAIALMYLAGKLNKFEVIDWQGRSSKQQKWWDMYVEGISMELLEDICHQVLDLYSPNKSEHSASVPAVTAPSTGNTLVPSVPSGGISAKENNSASANSQHTANSGQPQEISQSTPSKPLDNSKNSQLVSAPPSKKSKKEEVKTISPAKVDPQSAPVTQSYRYTYPYPPGYSQYPPTNNPSGSGVHNPSYPYSYPPAQHSPSVPRAPPPAAGTPTHPILSHPPTYSTPTNRYPPSVPSTSTSSHPSQQQQHQQQTHYNVPTHVTSRYSNAPQPAQYHPPSVPAPTHYAPPQNSQHRAPPSHSSHYSHVAAPRHSSYYPPSQSGGGAVPSGYMGQNYQQTPPNRQYYPPAS